MKDKTKTKKRILKNRRLQRTLCSLLASAMILGCAVIAAPDAGAADYTIDTTKHKPLTKNADTIYYWHEGLPPADAVDGTKYPVLITWEDKYYLATDQAFGKAIDDRAATRISDYLGKAESMNGMGKMAQKIGTADSYQKLGLQDRLISASRFKEYSPEIKISDAITPFDMNIENWYSSTKAYGRIVKMPLQGFNYLNQYILKNQNNTYGREELAAMARPIARYTMSSNAVLNNNAAYQEYLALSNDPGSSIDELLKNGFAVTTELPNVPYLVCAETSPKTNSGLNASSMALNKTTQSRWGIWIPRPEGQWTGDYLKAQNNWLVGMQHYDVNFTDVVGYTTAQGSQYRCDVLYDFYLDFMSGPDELMGGPTGTDVRPSPYNPKNFIDPEYKVSVPSYSNPQVTTGYTEVQRFDESADLQRRTWIFDRQSDGTYTIGTYCSINSYIPSRMPYCLSETETNILVGYGYMNRAENLPTGQHMSLLHDGGTLVSYGSDNYYQSAFIVSQTVGGQDNFKNKFRIFWAEPITINYYRSNFTVVDGQVSTIDGPACIDDGAVYRVNDGGVLVLTDWIINNGAIIVKKGGTLIIQENTDAYGHTRYGTMISQITGGDGGRIACEGTIIIMPGCKVFGGGKYGIQLGDGAYVVNYGTIGSENFTCYHEYTIENRIEDSVVFAGSGVTGCGMSLTNYKITGNYYPAKGNREKAFSVSMAANSVYGKGKAKYYVNPNVKNADVNKPPRNGSVVDAVTYPERIYTFTADQFYDFTFPYYFDGGMMRFIWLYKGEKMEMWNTGDAVFYVSENIGGIYYDTTRVVNSEDHVEIIQGGRHEQWRDSVYYIGREIFYGYLKNWAPPSGTVVYYDKD